MLKIAVLISGGGSNLESIMNCIDSGYLKEIEIVSVIADREASGLSKAKSRGYKTLLLDRKIYKEDLSNQILKAIDGKVDYIVLAGFLSIIGDNLIKKLKKKIKNIHPSLIPSFCGAGMYGMKVHEAVIKKGVKYSGCTVHFVNEEVDGGAIISQQIVEVSFEDTASILQKKILKEEHKILPKVLKELSELNLEIIDGRVKLQ